MRLACARARDQPISASSSGRATSARPSASAITSSSQVAGAFGVADRRNSSARASLVASGSSPLASPGSQAGACSGPSRRFRCSCGRRGAAGSGRVQVERQRTEVELEHPGIGGGRSRRGGGGSGGRLDRRAQVEADAVLGQRQAGRIQADRLGGRRGQVEAGAGACRQVERVQSATASVASVASASRPWLARGQPAAGCVRIQAGGRRAVPRRPARAGIVQREVEVEVQVDGAAGGSLRQRLRCRAAAMPTLRRRRRIAAGGLAARLVQRVGRVELAPQLADVRPLGALALRQREELRWPAARSPWCRAAWRRSRAAWRGWPGAPG